LCSLVVSAASIGISEGTTLIINDNYNTTGSGSGFALGSGVNTGINPPTTRLTGQAAPNLRYIKTSGTKADTAHTITANKFQISRVASDSSTISLSSSGTGPFDFGSVLNSLAASPVLPSVYDISITISNGAASNQRCSFAISSAQGTANNWDFGLQLVHTNTSDAYYNVFKRISPTAGGAQLNSVIGIVPYPTPASLVIRVTDAGAELSTSNTVIQVSTNAGASWFYNSSADSELPTGFHFPAASRFIYWDAAGGAGPVTYDNFSINSISGPTTGPRTWSGAGSDANWNTAANWGGVVPGTGDSLIFSGTTQQTNNNDLSGLNVTALTFGNGGFSLGGSAFTNSGTVSNLAGLNIFTGELDWGSTASKLWSIAGGSEVQLANLTSVEVNGDHSLVGGGTLRVKGTMSIGQATTANPAFVVNEGQHIIDGGTFTSRGGYRIGSVAVAPAGALTVVSNGGTMSLTVSGANLRVGDNSNSVTSRLILNNGTLIMAGGSIGIPYAAGATGEIWQTGSRVSGAIVNFNQNGAGFGFYGITNSTLEALQIKKTTGSSLSRIYFDNAVLRTANGASNNAFFSGLNIAEIESAGLTIDATSDVIIDQVLRGAGGLVKSNSAAALLTAVNTFAGPSYVQAGKLAFATVTNATSVQVADGAEFGVYEKTVGSTLSIPSLSFLGSSFGVLSFDLSTFGSPTAPLLRVGSLSVNGPVQINIANGIQLQIGTITLVSYSGSIAGGFQFSLGGLPPGVSATLINNSANSSIDLNITSVPGYHWTGAVNGDWDNGTQNWIDLGTGLPSTFQDNFGAEFMDDSATGNINIPGFPMPSIISVSNNTLPYVWSGGALTVPLIRKNGPGSVTRLETGADLVNAMELNQGSFIASNVFDATFSTVLSDTGAGNGAFVVAGPSVFTVYSTNSNYHGDVVIQQGLVKIEADRSLGANTASIVISNGATLDVNDFSPGAEPVFVAGDGTTGQGAIIDSTTTGSVDANLRDVTLTGDTTFGVPTGGRWDLRIRSGTGVAPGLKGNGFNLTKVGSGTVSIACQRSLGASTPYWHMNLGNVIVKQGSLAFAESLSLDNPANGIFLYPGASLQFYDLNVTNPVLRNIYCTNATLNCGGANTDTNIVNGNIYLSGANSIKPDQAAYIINGSISGSGSFGMSANDPGRVCLNGVNTFAGDLTVTNGMVGGAGTWAGNLVMLAGTNAPGWLNPISTLTVNGAVTLAGTTLMKINRALSPNSDGISAGGTLSASGLLIVSVAPGAPPPQGGDVYTLFNKGVTGFSSVVMPSLTAGLTWNTSNLAVNGTVSVSGSSTPPTISNLKVSGNNFIFSGTGGTQGNSYTVLSSTNLSLPSAWTPIATNTFGAAGTFSVTNTISAGVPADFFRISVP
jgi:hypothetical protein